MVVHAGDDAPGAGFESARHHVVQGGVGEKGVRQAALELLLVAVFAKLGRSLEHVLVAGELDWRGGSRGHAGAGIEGCRVAHVPDRAEMGIDAEVIMLAIELRAFAGAVVKRDAGVVHARRGGDGERFAGIDGSGDVEAQGFGARVDSGGEVVDESAGAKTLRATSVRVEFGKFRDGLKVGVAAIPRDSGESAGGSPEPLAGEGGVHVRAATGLAAATDVVQGVVRQFAGAGELAREVLQIEFVVASGFVEELLQCLGVGELAFAHIVVVEADLAQVIFLKPLDQAVAAAQLALGELAGVAVEGIGTAGAVEQVCRHLDAVRQLLGGVEGQHGHGVLGAVRGGEDGFAIERQKLHRHGAVAEQVGCGSMRAQVHLGTRAAPAHAAEGVAGAGGGQIAPAVFVEAVGADVIAQGAGAEGATAAHVRRHHAPTVRTAPCLEPHSGRAEPVLHAQAQRAAESVESERRIGAAHELHAVDGRDRHQVPVHGVAERFVEASAVDVYGNALREPQQRRGGVAAILQIRLQGVVLGIVQANAGEGAFEEVGKVEAERTIHLIGVGGLAGIGQLGRGHSGAIVRRGCDNDDLLDQGIGAFLANRIATSRRHAGTGDGHKGPARGHGLWRVVNHPRRFPSAPTGWSGTSRGLCAVRPAPSRGARPVPCRAGRRWRSP